MTRGAGCGPAARAHRLMVVALALLAAGAARAGIPSYAGPPPPPLRLDKTASLPPLPVPQNLLPVIDAAIAEGRLDTAADVIARALPQHDSPALRLRAAELALARGALSEAATGFGDLVGEADVAAPAQQGLGLARLRQGNLPAATRALDAALALDPTLVRALTARGVIADRLRDFAAADGFYARAVALAPSSATVLTNRGYSLLLRGRAAEAEVDLARAVALDPKLAAAQTDLRLARALQGKYQEAFDGATRSSLAADLNTVGFAAMARGDYATAESYFNRALAINPRFDQVAAANLRYLAQRTHPGADGDATLPD